MRKWIFFDNEEVDLSLVDEEHFYDKQIVKFKILKLQPKNKFDKRKLYQNHKQNKKNKKKTHTHAICCSIFKKRNKREKNKKEKQIRKYLFFKE
jgi:hypothetical protein